MRKCSKLVIFGEFVHSEEGATEDYLSILHRHFSICPAYISPSPFCPPSAWSTPCTRLAWSVGLHNVHWCTQEASGFSADLLAPCAAAKCFTVLWWQTSLAGLLAFQWNRGGLEIGRGSPKFAHLHLSHFAKPLKKPNIHKRHSEYNPNMELVRPS